VAAAVAHLLPGDTRKSSDVLLRRDEGRAIVVDSDPRDVGLLPELAVGEDILGRVSRHGDAAAGQKQSRVRLGEVFPSTLRHVDLQGTGKSRAYGYEPRLVKFAFADCENAGFYIHIGKRKESASLMRRAAP